MSKKFLCEAYNGLSSGCVEYIRLSNGYHPTLPASSPDSNFILLLYLVGNIYNI